LKKQFICKDCGITYTASYTKTGVCPKCYGSRYRKKNWKATNPYWHKVRSTPPKTRQGIWQQDRITQPTERWLNNSDIITYSEYSRHHPVLYRDGINQHSDLVREHYTAQNNMIINILFDENI